MQPPSELVLRYGQRNNEVEKLQALLNSRFGNGRDLRIDGYFGPKTLRAVHAFQRSRSITANGIVAMRTWRELILAKAPGKATSELLAWPLHKKYEELVRRLDHKLRPDLRVHVNALPAGGSLADILTEIAACDIFGAGIGRLLVLGEGPACALAHALHTAALAAQDPEMEEASDHLTRAFEMGGRDLPVALGRFSLGNRNRNAGGQDASPSADSGAPAQPKPKSQAAAALRPSSPAEDSTFDAALNAQAQAAVLQKAAALGVPFCEECSRRRQAAA